MEYAMSASETRPPATCIYRRTGLSRAQVNVMQRLTDIVRAIRCTLAAAAALLALSTQPLLAEPNAKEKDKVPPIEFVQGRIWGNMRMAGFELMGEIRTNSKTYPIILRTKGYEMIYEFQKEPLHIRVVISPEKSVVQKRASAQDKWEDLTGKARLDQILDTDITYEDLGLEFIRWDVVETLGTDSIKTLKSWAFEAKPNPNSPSRFSKARYWISSDYGAFLRVDGYNEKNEVIKRVEVNGVTRVGKAYVIKQMLISNMIPGRSIAKSRTWIDIRDTKAEPAPDKDKASVSDKETTADKAPPPTPVSTESIPTARPVPKTPKASKAD
ncbi:outer membrane lipoprotein-sorting protein [Verrucomicrobia bacterium LW23]|nr:outer membrane lipoprotein-sorting protein [Verrucomicrobia bacterium LW23]